MIKKLLNDYKVEFIIFTLILLSRILLADYSNSFHSMDCVNYILAVDDYNIYQERPHLPGYIIYVAFFKFLNIFFTNGNTLFIVFQGIFQAISGVILYKVLKFININSKLILLFVFSLPTIYFFGIVSEIYSIDLLIISFYLYLYHKKYILYLLPYVFFIAGIRQSSGGILLLSTIFLFIYELKYKNITLKNISISFAFSILLFLLWFIPLIISMGGLENYLLELDKQKDLLVSYKLYNNIISFFTYSFFYLTPISILLIFSKKNKLNIDFKTKVFYLLIIVPQLILFIFYHYNKGYALLLIPAMIIFLSFYYSFNYKAITILSLIQLTFFYFYPGEIPSFNTQILNNYRNISVYETWYERFKYWWLPTIDGNLKTVELHKDFEENYLKIKNIVKDNKLLIDNSVIIRARNFAFIAPDLKICEKTYNSMSSYEQYHKHINLTVENDLVENFKDFYILVEKEYFNIYLSKFSKILLETNTNYLIKIPEQNKLIYLIQNKSHFIE